MPATRKIVLQLGTVPSGFRVTVQIVVLVSTSVRVTVPWGFVDPTILGVTTVLRVTGWLTEEVAGADVTTTVVEPALTVCGNAVEGPAAW